MKFGHDTVMGVVLVVAGVLTFASTRSPSKTVRILALLGAAATIIIGLLLFFGLA
jgi:hypothetical protein